MKNNEIYLPYIFRGIEGTDKTVGMIYDQVCWNSDIT